MPRLMLVWTWGATVKTYEAGVGSGSAQRSTASLPVRTCLASASVVATGGAGTVALSGQWFANGDPKRQFLGGKEPAKPPALSSCFSHSESP